MCVLPPVLSWPFLTRFHVCVCLCVCTTSRDGDVYPHYFEMVKNAPRAVGVAPYYESTIRPMLQGKDMEAVMEAYNKEQDDGSE